jgi:hypothetical protein
MEMTLDPDHAFQRAEQRREQRAGGLERHA